VKLLASEFVWTIARSERVGAPPWTRTDGRTPANLFHGRLVALRPLRACKCAAPGERACAIFGERAGGRVRVGVGMSAGATLIWQRMFLDTAAMRRDRQSAKCSGNSARQSDKPRTWRTHARRGVHIIARTSAYVGMHVSPRPSPLLSVGVASRTQKRGLASHSARSLSLRSASLRVSCASLARTCLALPPPSPEP